MRNSRGTRRRGRRSRDVAGPQKTHSEHPNPQHRCGGVKVGTEQPEHGLIQARGVQHDNGANSSVNRPRMVLRNRTSRDPAHRFSRYRRRDAIGYSWPALRPKAMFIADAQHGKREWHPARDGVRRRWLAVPGCHSPSGACPPHMTNGPTPGPALQLRSRACRAFASASLDIRPAGPGA